MSDFLTAAERAESAFRAFVAQLPADSRDAIEAEAWENAFSAEVHAEYADDCERWNVALATAKQAADLRGITI